MQRLPRPRPDAEPRQRLPELQIGPARRPDMVLLEAALRRSGTGWSWSGWPAAGRARAASSRRDARTAPPAETPAARRDRRQPRRDQRRAPVMPSGVGRPVALHAAQASAAAFTEVDRDLHRRGPDLQRPGRGDRRVRRQRQPPVPRAHLGTPAARAPRPATLQPLGREIGAADHPPPHRRQPPAAPSPASAACPPPAPVAPREPGQRRRIDRAAEQQQAEHERRPRQQCTATRCAATCPGDAAPARASPASAPRCARTSQRHRRQPRMRRHRRHRHRRGAAQAAQSHPKPVHRRLPDTFRRPRRRV